MKQYLICVCALLMCLTGCSKSDIPPENPSDSTSAPTISVSDKSRAEASASDPNQDILVLQPAELDPTASKAEDPTLIQTEYYIVRIPESWLENCVYQTLSGENGNYSLNFYEKRSYEQFEGGYLFSLNLLPLDEEYAYFPAYEELGTLSTADGKQFDLIVLYPTDVQFEPDTQEKYMELDGQVPQVVASLIPTQGCTLSSITPPVFKVEDSRANGNWVYSPSALESQHLTINSDGTFLTYLSSMGEVKETTSGSFEILSDDGVYQTFLFVCEDGSDSWTAQIWQTTLTDQSGTSYDGLVYVTDSGETLYFTGIKYA